MGTYYKLINVTKQQTYEPANGMVKYSNFIWFAEEAMELLLGPWAGDEVRLVGDYSDDGGLYFHSEAWASVKPPFYEEEEGRNRRLKTTLDKNGVLKLLTRFVRDLGAETVAVALDVAITQTSKSE